MSCKKDLNCFNRFLIISRFYTERRQNTEALNGIDIKIV